MDARRLVGHRAPGPGSRAGRAPVLFRAPSCCYPGSGEIGVRGRKDRGLMMNSGARGTGRGGALCGSRGAGAAAGPPRDPQPRSGGRESIESFVVVFLAFLLWSIEAEG